MWSTEKLGAVSGRRQEATLRPPVDPTLAPPPSREFAVPVQPPATRLPRRRMGHSSLACPEEGRAAEFLTETDSHSEIVVTHSKQRSGAFLTGTRIGYQAIRNLTNLLPGMLAGGRGSRSLFCPPTALIFIGFCEEFRPFLTGSAPQTEFDVTLSKQTTEKFLTGARIPFRRHQVSQDFRRNCTRGTRVAVHGSRRPPATSHSLALTKEGPLTTAFRYNAPAQTSPARLAT
jgi:hypothetical protein